MQAGESGTESGVIASLYNPNPTMAWPVSVQQQLFHLVLGNLLPLLYGLTPSDTFGDLFF
ncbi:hypothetical protein OK016_02685 [Vibrio chagasii]|nr:hypothetical protein [Vibrio chagasii]